MRRGSTERFDNAAWTVSSAWKRLGHLIRPEYMHLVEDNGLGDPPREPVWAGRLASVGSIEYAAMLSLCMGTTLAGNVLEIGGGYGGLASAGLRQGVPCWTIVDIPGVAECSRWYLAEFGDRARVISPEEFAGECGSYDLVIQTRGFMEMSRPEIKFYFDRIQGGLVPVGGRFFTINRLTKESSFVEYPFDDHWRVLLRDLWPEGPGMAMLLLERTDSPLADVRRALAGWR